MPTAGAEWPDLDVAKRAALDGLGCPVRPDRSCRRNGSHVRMCGPALEVALLQQPRRSQDGPCGSGRVAVAGRCRLARTAARLLRGDDLLVRDGGDLARPPGPAADRSSVGCEQQRPCRIGADENRYFSARRRTPGLGNGAQHERAVGDLGLDAVAAVQAECLSQLGRKGQPTVIVKLQGGHGRIIVRACRGGGRGGCVHAPRVVRAVVARHETSGQGTGSIPGLASAASAAGRIPSDPRTANPSARLATTSLLPAPTIVGYALEGPGRPRANSTRRRPFAVSIACASRPSLGAPADRSPGSNRPPHCRPALCPAAGPDARRMGCSRALLSPSSSSCGHRPEARPRRSRDRLRAARGCRRDSRTRSCHASFKPSLPAFMPSLSRAVSR